MKVILGDNPFFGVNHASGSLEPLPETERFSRASEVVSRFESLGGNVMMLTNHPSASRLMDRLGAELSSELDIALVLPYPHKYNDLVASHGYIGLANKILRSNLLSLLMAMLYFLIGLNYRKWLLRALLFSELKEFSKYRERVKYVCLHNILTDMFIAGSNDRLLSDFVDLVQEMGLEPVLITQNPKAAALAIGRSDYTLCFSLNPTGYMVNPTVTEVVDFLKSMTKDRPSVWAMQILASGVATTQDALDFLKDISVVDGILYATTRPERITAFYAAAEKYYTIS